MSKACYRLPLLLLLSAAAGGQPPSIEGQGNPDDGRRDFAGNCAACHSNLADGPRQMGPSLFGVVGRHAGSVADFRYSKAMRSADIVWQQSTLENFLRDPQAAVPGTVMSIAGIDDPKERADLVAYLASLR